MERRNLPYGDGKGPQSSSNGTSSLTVDSQVNNNNYGNSTGRRGPQSGNFVIQPQQALHVSYTPPPDITSGQYSPYNINNPPGLLPTQAPPGFFFPPPPQQQNVYHCNSQFHPQMTMYPMQHQQQQQGYNQEGYFYIPSAPLHDTNFNLKKSQQELEDYEISQRLSMLLDVGGGPGRGCNMDNVKLRNVQQQQGNNNIHDSLPSSSSNSMSSNSSGFKSLPPTLPIIDPMIENIVGSMSISGSYTHFGPPSIAMTGGVTGQTNVSCSSVVGGGVCSSQIVNNNNSSVGKVSPLSFTPSPSSIQQQQQIEMKNLQSSLLKEMNLREKSGIIHPRVIGKESPGLDMFPQQRASKDGMDKSRPQTPKLSYSEVLTKNQSNQGTNFQKVPSSSNSPSPAPYRTLDNAITTTTTTTNSSNNNGMGSNRRTSGHNLQGDFTTASNSSSSSSSPVTRPKVASNNNSTSSYTTNGLGRNRKGKENSSSSSSNTSSKSSTTRTTPNVTPTHVNGGGSLQNEQQFQKMGKADRKVLGSNLLNTTSMEGSPTIGKSQTRSSTSSTTSTSGTGKNNSKTFQFEFDIEDLDDVYDKFGSGGGTNGNKSATTKRGSGSGVSSGYSGKSGNKIYINGTSSSNLTSGVEKKTGNVTLTNGNAGQTTSSLRKYRFDKNEKVRSRKGDRNCMVRRVRLLTTIWINSIWLNLISAVNWLWSLVVNVGTLSCSLAYSLLEDFYAWWRCNGIPSVRRKVETSRRDAWNKVCNVWHKVRLKIPWWKSKEAESESSNNYGLNGKNDDIFSMMGPERQIILPTTGEEALKRLLSVKGQDPYSILGVPSNSSDETVRRYYKRQAVLVHPDKNVVPGAEEAFKILARAFELVGEPVKRMEYHRQLMSKEIVSREIGNLLEQLRKKMESVTNTIRCTKCSSRHKKVRTDRPLFAARYCAQCRINHAAREGDLWAERGKGFFGLSWHLNYYTCMENAVWEVNEWATCQKKNLVHLLHDSHNIMYRLVAGGGGVGKNNSRKESSTKGGSSTSESQQPSGFDEHGPSAQENVNAEFDDDWNTLINNLCRSSASSSSGIPSSNNNKNPSSATNSNIGSKGTGTSSTKFGGIDLGDSGGNLPNSTNSASTGLSGSTTKRRGKFKRK